MMSDDDNPYRSPTPEALNAEVLPIDVDQNMRKAQQLLFWSFLIAITLGWTCIGAIVSVYLTLRAVQLIDRSKQTRGSAFAAFNFVLAIGILFGSALFYCGGGVEYLTDAFTS